MEILKYIVVDWRETRLIKMLYFGQKAVMRISDVDTEPAGIGRGSIRGYKLSPLLYIIHDEEIIK
jgi:hypothetical protein